MGLDNVESILFLFAFHFLEAFHLPHIFLGSPCVKNGPPSFNVFLRVKRVLGEGRRECEVLVNVFPVFKDDNPVLGQKLGIMNVLRGKEERVCGYIIVIAFHHRLEVKAKKRK